MTADLVVGVTTAGWIAVAVVGLVIAVPVFAAAILSAIKEDL